MRQHGEGVTLMPLHLTSWTARTVAEEAFQKDLPVRSVGGNLKGFEEVSDLYRVH